jgi:hypothetical protein
MNKQQSKIRVEKLKIEILQKLEKVTEKIADISQILDPMKPRIQITLAIISARQAQGRYLPIKERIKYYLLKQNFDLISITTTETHIRIKSILTQLDKLNELVKKVDD